MKNRMSIVIFFTLFFLLSCSSDDTMFNIDSVDYTLNQINLGVAFPPNSTTEHRRFSIEHMNNLNLEWCRINQSWANREPENNIFNWTPLRDRLNQFKADNKKILLTIDMKEFPLWWLNLESDSLRVSEFSEFCNGLIAEFPTEISIIQFGNEWNWEIDSYLPGSNKDELYIGMSNALYDSISAQPELNRPKIALGSLSIDGLRFISYTAGSITNVEFEKGNLYSEADINSLELNKIENLNRIKNIITNINFNVVDLHFYDDYWNWNIYLSDVKNLITSVGKSSTTLDYIAGEFGGPHPTLEYSDENYLNYRVISYIDRLDTIGISMALFFKLMESPDSSLVLHPNSFLIDENQQTNNRYEILKRFGDNNY